MGRSVKDILRRNFSVIRWNGRFAEAFTYPEEQGVWFIWGNSGNGKTSFVMQLADELSKNYRVFFNSLEEGLKLTLKQHIIHNNVRGKIVFDAIPVEQLPGLHRRYKVVIVDSIQASGVHYQVWRKILQQMQNRLIILVSQADRKQPIGRTALRLKYDADLKLYVEGFRVVSNGRYNPGGEYIIWHEGYQKYYQRLNEQHE